MTTATIERPKRATLISYGILPTNPNARRKWIARDALRTFSVIKAQTTCGAFTYATPKEVTLPNGYTYMSGVGHCGLTNSCPWCSPRKLVAKRERVRALGEEAIEGGGYAVMATLTLRRAPNQPLGVGYRNLDKVRAKFRRKMKSIEAKHGISSSMFTLEETFSTATRWHPHLHWVWFVPSTMNEVEYRAFESAVIDAWKQSAALAGITGVSLRAQRLRRFRSAEDMKKLASYVTKHGFFPSDPPRANSGGGLRGLSPFEVLELARTTGDFFWISAYNEFERANKGKHRVQFYVK